MIEFIPGNTYILALLIQQQNDPTSQKSAAAGLSPVMAFVTLAPMSATDTIDSAALVQAQATEVGDYVMEDDTIARKYLATFLGSDNRVPFSNAIADSRNKQVYIYTAYANELLEPTLGLIVAAKPYRR